MLWSEQTRNRRPWVREWGEGAIILCYYIVFVLHVDNVFLKVYLLFSNISTLIYSLSFLLYSSFTHFFPRLSSPLSSHPAEPSLPITSFHQPISFFTFLICMLFLLTSALLFLAQATSVRLSVVELLDLPLYLLGSFSQSIL